MTSRITTTVAATSLLAFVGLATLVGCSSGQDSGADATSGAVAPDAPQDGRRGAAGSEAYDAADASGANALDGLSVDGTLRTEQADDPGTDPALIKRGTIGLVADDVARARLAVLHDVDRVDGSVDDEETVADEDGVVTSVRMVLRVPADRYDEVTEDLKGIATLSDATTSSTDVRDRIIRTRVQIGVQRDAIERIRLLLDRANDIGDIIRIESELTDRIARLDTLRRTAAYLADQTSMSTINLSIEKSPKHPAPTDEKKRTGFLAGLDRGWGAFSDTVVWLAGAVGTLLPFAVALAVLGVPLGWLLRRRLRGRRTVTPAAG